MQTRNRSRFLMTEARDPQGGRRRLHPDVRFVIAQVLSVR
jgi:hypothetical protein